MKLLTIEEHQQIVENLVKLARNVDNVRSHAAGPEFTSLMVCFLLHNLTSANSLLQLRDSFTNKYFPATVGYVIARSMLETEVTAHYIAQDPVERSRQYIDYEHVLNKKNLDAHKKHLHSRDIQWRHAMEFMWKNTLASKEADINKKYENVRSRYERVNKAGKIVRYRNWADKSIRDIACAVNHEEAYDIFYTDLSSYTHADVKLANQFLRINSDELSWSQRPRDSDVGHVFRYVASFLTCFLELFAEQFHVKTTDQIRNCWNIKKL